MMSDPKNEFLDLATDCFGDDVEMQLSARDAISRRLLSEKGAFEKANARLKQNRQRLGWRIPVIYTLIVLAIACIAAHSFYHVYRAKHLVEGIGFLKMPIPSNDSTGWEFYFEDLSKKDRLLLFGDESHSDPSMRAKGLWDTESDNPGAYVEYIKAYESQWGAYPSDMFEVADRIDPGNAMYYFYQASNLVDSCISVSHSRGPPLRKKRRSGVSSGKSAKSATGKIYTITDEEKYSEALALFRHGLTLPKCTNYGGEMMTRRVPLLQRDDHDWVTRIIPFYYLIINDRSMISIKKLDDLLHAEAQRCEKAKDVEGLHQLINDWKKICRHLHSAGETLIDALIVRAFIHSPCNAFAAAAKACGLPELEKKFSDLDSKMTYEKGQRSSSAYVENIERDFYTKASMLSYGSTPVVTKQVNHPEVLPELDFTYDRLADHAFWNRVASFLISILLLVIALITMICKYSGNKLVSKMACRLYGLFGLKDWLFVISLGILLPVAVYWLVNGLRTPLSVQNWYVGYEGMTLPVGQSLSLLLLLIFMPMLTIKYRLKQLIPLKHEDRVWLIWCSALLALAAMPIFGYALSRENHTDLLIKIGYTMQGCSLFILLFSPFAGYVMRQKKSVMGVIHHTEQHILLPVFMVGALVMALQIPIYYQKEKHWVELDQVFKISPEYTSYTQYESWVTKQMLIELEQQIQEIETE